MRALLPALLAGASLAHAQPAAEPPPEGRVVYANRCRICHGPNMITPGGAAYDLRKFPLDDRERFERSVMGGKGNMPAWQGVLTPAELDALWAYVQTRGR